MKYLHLNLDFHRMMLRLIGIQSIHVMGKLNILHMGKLTMYLATPLTNLEFNLQSQLSKMISGSLEKKGLLKVRPRLDPIVASQIKFATHQLPEESEIFKCILIREVKYKSLL